MEECVFCGIAAGKIPAVKEYEDDDVVAFKDIKPSAPVHVLVLPKKHIGSLETAEEADREVLGKIQLTISGLAKKLGIAEGYKIVLNGGRYQEVKHVHYHLLGGAEGGEK